MLSGSCKALGISLSTYYYHSDNNNAAKTLEDNVIAMEMEAVIEKYDPESGHRPITRVLKRTRTIGKKRVILIHAGKKS